MPLHRRSNARALALDPIFAGKDLTSVLPKDHFPNHESRAQDVFEAIRDELLLDGNARQNLATFCQTWEEPQVHQLMDLAIDKNLIDKDEYPQSAELEKRCVHLLSDLWHAPSGGNPVGCSTIGSSEACMLAGLAMKWRWRKKRQASGQSSDRPNLVCGPVQICWDKFARYFDVELREVGMAPGRYGMDVEQMLERVDENTIGVVPTLGVTYTGIYEPVRELSQALDRLQERTGLDVDLHVDAASGGFLAPFCARDLLWDFRLPRVKSINASGHKFGLAPLGVGWVVWRDQAELPGELVFHVDYLGGDMPTFQLNFSRPAGQIIAQYYEFIRLGREGYHKIQSACYGVARDLARAIAQLGPFTILHDGEPSRGIPAVSWTLREGANPGYSLFDLADRLRVRGWQVPAYTLTGELSKQPVQRILVRQGVTHDLAELLLEDMRRAIEHFGAHPISVHLNETEAGGYNHT